MAYQPHTRFHYSILLSYLSYEYGSFNNISGMDLVESGYKKIRICLCVKNIPTEKITCSGFMLASGLLPLLLHEWIGYYNG